ncbi:MAG: GSU2204 family outer membrane beta-barrel protein, partial [Desulfuromonadales bacterium]
MKQCHIWLLALTSVMALVATSTFAIAEEAVPMNGRVEIGATNTDLDDNPARVNEYVKHRRDQGSGVAGAIDLEASGENSAVDLSASFDGDVATDLGFGFDARAFKLDISFQEFDHWKDHDTLGHVGATMRGDIAGEQPRVTTDGTVGQIGVDTMPEANARYEQELANDYIITHSEWENEAEVTLPALPNVTLHAGLRVEKREGVEQARTLSKCNQCHVQANPKNINEETEDLTLGATGKFGLITVEYEYLTRDFEDNSGATTYNYLGSGAIHGGVIDSTALLYTGDQEYAQTPDSEKDSHTLKARVDINRDSSVSATYVNAEVESNKDGDVSYTLDQSSLTSEFESFFLKGNTKIGGLRLSLRGG